VSIAPSPNTVTVRSIGRRRASAAGRRLNRGGAEPRRVVDDQAAAGDAAQLGSVARQSGMCISSRTLTVVEAAIGDGRCCASPRNEPTAADAQATRAWPTRHLAR
jgi:hypothetical protein